MPNAIILSLAALILVGAVGAYFWYCTRKDICPIPHTWLSSLGFRQKTVGRSIAPTQQTVPLAVSDPNRAALLADLQGNILAGHGRQTLRGHEQGHHRHERGGGGTLCRGVRFRQSWVGRI